ncbi:hypothetical protein [Nonomuraea sp. NPDC049480]|uniref:hypothetical protein n=1 Tax=Nonomuraea sp. NPDC049480 TaxID=3364353 RepID=UPI0037A13A73
MHMPRWRTYGTTPGHQREQGEIKSWSRSQGCWWSMTVGIAAATGVEPDRIDQPPADSMR